jgi:hypothetical protein
VLEANGVDDLVDAAELLLAQGKSGPGPKSPICSTGSPRRKSTGTEDSHGDWPVRVRRLVPVLAMNHLVSGTPPRMW